MARLTCFLALLHVYRALGGDSFWDTTIKLAETVTLECVHPLTLNLTQIEWFRLGATKKESIAIFHPDYGEVIREPYVGRVDVVKSPLEPNYRVLSIRNASEADVGFYSCLLDTFPHGSWEKVIQVVPSDHFETAVSPNSHVVSETGKNVTLTYELQMNGSVQHVTWEKVQSRQIDLLTRCSLPEGRSNISKYPRQILSTCGQRLRRSTIVLPHVTASDSGLYRCLFWADTGENETFVFKLTVTDDTPNPTATSDTSHICIDEQDAESKDKQLISEGRRVERGGATLIGDALPWEQCRVRIGTPGTYSGFALNVVIKNADKTVNHYILFTAGGPVLLLLFVILIAIVILIVRNRRQKRFQCKEPQQTKSKASNNYRSPPFTTQPSDGAGEDVYVNFPTFSRRPKTRV